MAWTLENSRNNEARKIVWELIPYAHGAVLDIGCGPYKALPHFTGVDNGHHWGSQGIDIRAEAGDLSRFADCSHDTVFSSHLLEHIPYEKVPAVLTEWLRVLKPGGHLILYLPDADQYPRVGEHGANPDHKWNVDFQLVMNALEFTPCGLDLVDYQVRSERDEYSLFFVFKKLETLDRVQSWKLPKPAKTAAVVRYGAIGDMIQMSSILPWLKEQGYHVTLYCQAGQGYETIKHDPHVDRFIVQGRDEVPNQFLAEFWDETKKKYDKWINLCESVEGTLLASPGRASFDWPNQVRAKYLDRNYLEFTHELAEVPAPYRPKFYSTGKEREKARFQAQKWGARNVLWSLAGSSGHKVWPHLDEIIDRMLRAYPDVHVVLVGDETCKLLEQSWCRWDEGKQDFVETVSRIHLKSGKWTIRESLCFAEVADLIIGTETGLLNAAGSMEAAKVITLSHSSPEMLTKHWVNTIALQQPKGVGCAKSPCRQLHGGSNTDAWLDCPQHQDTGTALCQYHIGPEQMWAAIQAVLGVPMRRVA